MSGVSEVMAPPGDGEGLPGWMAHGGVLALGALLAWLSATMPAQLPFFMPWDFSWPEYLTIALVLLWYGRGLARLAPAQRPSPAALLRLCNSRCWCRSCSSGCSISG